MNNPQEMNRKFVKLTFTKVKTEPMEEGQITPPNILTKVTTRIFEIVPLPENPCDCLDHWKDSKITAECIALWERRSLRGLSQGSASIYIFMKKEELN